MKPHQLFKKNFPGDRIKAWGREYDVVECQTEDGIPLDLLSTEDCLKRCEMCAMPRCYCAMVACSSDYRDDKRNIIFVKPTDNADRVD